MPVRWTLDHAKRLVEVVVTGDVSAEEATHFFDELEAADAIPYDKLFDVVEATPRVNEAIMAIVSERVARYRSNGLIAVAVPGAYFEGLAKLVLLAVDASHRARVFRTVPEARQWLDSAERARSSAEETTQ